MNDPDNSMEETGVQPTPEDAFSYLVPIGYRQTSTCGYCRRSDSTGHTFYARATSMSPAFYQLLLEKSWRRSGTLLYRPNQRDACCPHYTLRLDSTRCRLAKDQRHAINKFNKYVLGDDYIKQAARLYPRSHEEARRRNAEFVLVDRIHEAETAKLQTPPQPAHTFEVTLESDEFTEEKYAIFENYQQVVHHEKPSKISRQSFRRFLCTSPLRRGVFKSSDGRERQVGSFHHCYRLDGRLVAIGVLDLLPDCVSAKYFLYHESIHNFQPGKLGALHEIALAAEMGYRFWYSGFYIHTCPKMQYKVDFKPQSILDPDLHRWTELDKATIALFDEKGYLHLERHPSRTAETPDVVSHNLAIAGDGAETAASALHTTEIPAIEATGDAPEEQELSDHHSQEGEDEDDDDGDAEVEVPLWKSNMPGLPSIDTMQTVPLDIIPVRLDQGFISAADLFQWENEDLCDTKTAKGMVAEMAAMVGVELLLQWALDFRRASAAD